MQTIEKNLSQIKHLIHEYELSYSRPRDSVTLLAASKGQSIDKIKNAFLAGQRIFGENYLQEALAKMDALIDYPIEWHFIGRIQRNKTRKIAERFSWVDSVNDLNIAERLNSQRPLTLPPLNICLEVNISNERSKAGASTIEILALARNCLKLSNLKLRGLMAIPAPQSSFDQQRSEFHKLADLFNKLNDQGVKLDTLSMGMSSDFKAAIAEGATCVRIGSALFGAR